MIILAKKCSHDNCDVNLISSKNLKLYETYFLAKFSLVLFQKYCLEKVQKAEDYDTLDKSFDKISDDLMKNLKIYLKYVNENYRV